MKVLAIDCSAKSVSAAIAENGKLIAEGFLNIKLTHSETLMPIIEQLLSNSRLTLADIDAFAVTAGPGSFTGIRIGISAVKGMAFSEQKPVFAFSTLEAMALSLANSKFLTGTVCGLMDARRNQFYNALFKLENGKITRLTDDRTVEAEILKDELKQYDSPLILMGDGAELFVRSTEGKGIPVKLPPEHLKLQRASSVSFAAEGRAAAGDTVDPDKLLPVYLRLPQAERELKKKQEAAKQ